ncbi:MAG TPA: STAS domain-containing protein [Gemmatimonadaceae bacterium]|jgi:anti-sigma B factor antagonist|nr:STAS domain-containing protein [Gemmatimonadaceae bacterium]
MAAFSTERDGDLLIVAVEGQLVVGNRAEFKQLVFDQLEDGARRVLIDFSGTAYIDSSGLGALVSLGKRIRDEGGALHLTGLNEDLRTLFELTRLDTLFQLFDRRADALAAF